MLEQRLKVCSYDVLPDGTLKPSALQRYCQQAALEDVSASGATYQALRARHMVFVLMRLSADFRTEIRSADELLLRTHPYKNDGVMFYRAFELFRGGETVGTMDTRWVLLDTEKRVILRPAHYTFPMTETQPTEELPPIERRILLTATDRTAVRSVRLTDMDENRHLNNCVYSDWAIDDAPIDLDKTRLRYICIHFEHEAYLNDELEIRYQKDPDGCRLVAFNKTGDRNCFSAVLRTEPKQ